MSLKLEINYAQGHMFHFLTSLAQKKNYAHKLAHDIQRLVAFPRYIKARGLTLV